LKLYKDGALAATTPYTGTPASGVGDLYVGIQGTSGGVLTRPSSGRLGLLSYHTTALSADTIAAMYLAATWYQGGLSVDLAITEARQAQDWLRQICQLRGIRFGFSGSSITC